MAGVKSRPPLRLGPFLLPGEGGVYGVWLASLAYGVAGLSVEDRLAAASALVGSVLSLLLLERARQGSLTPVAIVLLVYAPAFRAGWSASAFAAAGALALLAPAFRGLGLRGIIAGGSLIAAHGGILWSVGNPGDYLGALAPTVYALLTVSHAAAVVARRVDIVWREVFTAYAAVSVLVLGWGLAGLEGKAILLAMDTGLRGILLHSGAYYRVKLKVYGFHEVFHSLAVMAALALL